MSILTRIAELFAPNPYREYFEQLRFCGVSQEHALEIIEKLTSGLGQADDNLDAAVEFAKAGIEGDEIAAAVNACHYALSSAHVRPAGAATREQLLATVLPVAYIKAMTGDLYLAQPIMRTVHEWIRSVRP